MIEFKIGDYVKIDNETGTVIELRYSDRLCNEVYPIVWFDFRNDYQALMPRYLTKITKEERLLLILKHTVAN
jgi:hypothetical protein